MLFFVKGAIPFLIFFGGGGIRGGFLGIGCGARGSGWRALGVRFYELAIQKSCGAVSSLSCIVRSSDKIKWVPGLG